MTLLCRNEFQNSLHLDNEWINHAIKNRFSIRMYCYTDRHIFSKNLKGFEKNIELLKDDIFHKNALMKACNNLNTDYPDQDDLSYQRDYYLVRDADSLYFSGYFTILTKLNPSKARLEIKGREAWLVEMFVNKCIANSSTSKMFPVYMFSENMKCWCQLDSVNLKWIYIRRAPKPQGNYLAFSSHKVSSTAKMEISIL